MAIYSYNPSLKPRLEGETHGGEVPSVQERIKKLNTLREHLIRAWAIAVEAQKRSHGRRYKPKLFNINNLILLLTKNLT